MIKVQGNWAWERVPQFYYIIVTLVDAYTNAEELDSTLCWLCLHLDILVQSNIKPGSGPSHLFGPFEEGVGKIEEWKVAFSCPYHSALVLSISSSRWRLFTCSAWFKELKSGRQEALEKETFSYTECFHFQSELTANCQKPTTKLGILSWARYKWCLSLGADGGVWGSGNHGKGQLSNKDK